jgi:hypothetical protein
MTPADQDFSRVIRLVCSAVINRRAATECGGATGRTLERLASQRSDEVNQWAQQVADRATAASR